jgi:hypothetical protein
MPESNPMAAKALAEGEATTPEDVATLYSWANLHGAKYRDFSASRAQAREEARLRVEEAQAEERRRQEAEAERKAQEEAQLAVRLAAEAAEAARQAEAERLAEIARQAEAERQAVLAAQEAQRQAALQRSWQPPEPFAPVSQPASNPSPSIEYSGHAYDSERTAQPAPPPSQRPTRNPAPYAPPSQSQPQPAPSVPNPYQRQAHPPAANDFPDYPAAQYALPQYSAEPYLPQQVDPYAPSPWHAAETRESREMREPFSQPAWLAPEPPSAPAQPRNQTPAQDQNPIRRSQPSQPTQTYIPMYAQTPGNPPGSGSGTSYGSESGQGQNPGPVDDTLAGSRDRIANRWYALKNVFDPQAAPVEFLTGRRSREDQPRSLTRPGLILARRARAADRYRGIRPVAVLLWSTRSAPRDAAHLQSSGRERGGADSTGNDRP